MERYDQLSTNYINLPEKKENNFLPVLNFMKDVIVDSGHPT